jgi:hypothetical protein
MVTASPALRYPRQLQCGLDERGKDLPRLMNFRTRTTTFTLPPSPSGVIGLSMLASTGVRLLSLGALAVLT